jgi:maleylacetate reductase
MPVEALYAINANPIINLMALEGIRALAKSLPAIIASPSDKTARTSAQYGAWLCGTCLGSVGMARKRLKVSLTQVHTLIICNSTP